jgi:hypothetical protein
MKGDKRSTILFRAAATGESAIAPVILFPPSQRAQMRGSSGRGPRKGTLMASHIAFAPPVDGAKSGCRVEQEGQMNDDMFSTTPSTGMLVFLQKLISFRTAARETSWIGKRDEDNVRSRKEACPNLRENANLRRGDNNCPVRFVRATVQKGHDGDMFIRSTRGCINNQVIKIPPIYIRKKRFYQAYRRKMFEEETCMKKLLPFFLGPLQITASSFCVNINPIETTPRLSETYTGDQPSALR